jgi:hypothetical protein
MKQEEAGCVLISVSRLVAMTKQFAVLANLVMAEMAGFRTRGTSVCTCLVLLYHHNVHLTLARINRDL